MKDPALIETGEIIFTAHFTEACCMQDCNRKGVTCMRIQFVDESGVAHDTGDTRYICNECLREIMLNSLLNGSGDGPEPKGIMNS